MGYKRVAYGYTTGMENYGGTGAIQNVKSNGMACNVGATAPKLIATVRAGSNIDFIWTKWLPSHQGPMTTWMAPYSGNITTVDPTQLEFFKIHEDALHADGSWATDQMIAQRGAWNTTVPWDIKAGKYVVRHELTSLHFATKHSNYTRVPGGKIAPQFYVSCYNVEVVGSGTASPPGVKFPGAYNSRDPGIDYDIFVGNKKYIIPGPPAYKPSGVAPKLEPHPLRIISPTGTGDKKQDEAYLRLRDQYLANQAKTTDYFQSIGG